jgi:hypothetical protein
MEYMEPLRTDGMTSLRDKAKRRMRDGYELPAFPSTDDVASVEFGEFIRVCTDVLKQRTSDYDMFGGNESEYRLASDAVIVFNIAVVAKDADIIRVHHSLIQKVGSPRNLQWCTKLVRQAYPGTPVSSIITEQHVQAATDIKNAFWAWDEDAVDSPDLQDLIGNIVKLAFEDLTETDRIVALIGRGVFNRDKMCERLKEITDIESPLVEGTL